MPTDKDRQTVNVDFDSYTRFQEATEWTGQPIRVKVSRLLDWLGTQPDEIQGLILGALPSTNKPEFAKMLLESMAKEEGTPKTLQMPKTQPVAMSKAARKKSKSK